MDLPAYARRIGLPSLEARSIDDVRRLHRAQVIAMPFENLDVLAGLPIDLSLAALEDKLVRRRRGGYCFELNALFCAVLEALGVTTTPLLGRVHLGRTDDEVPPRTHRVTRFELDGRSWISDVGFGAPTPRVPYGLELDVEQDLDGDVVRLREGRLGLRLELRTEEGWRALYSFGLDRAYDVDFVVANHYTSTHPLSRFKAGPRLARTFASGRLTMGASEVLDTRLTPPSRQPTPRGEALRAMLERDFGLHVETPPSF